MLLELAYGKGVVSAQIPAEWELTEICADSAKPLPFPEKSLEECLANPTGTKPFDEIFTGKKTVAVVVPDITRKAGTKAILPQVLHRLEKLGIEKSGVTIIFATGIHQQQSEEQQRELVGDAILKGYNCLDHDPNGQTVEIEVPGGAPVRLNRHAAEADSLLLIGGVKAHYLAGFGGGRKMILPGISSYKDCMEFHRLCLDSDGKGGHPKVGPVTVDGNPLNERATRAAKAAGVDLLINTVLNNEGKIAFINAGDLLKSHRQACEFAAAHSVVKIEKRFDIVIASAGGYPGDINFIQSHKSLDNGFRAVKPGGAVILLAECSGGTGTDNFLNWFDHGSSKEMEKALRKNFAINGHTALAAREKSEACTVLMVSQMAPGDVKRIGMNPVKGFGEAVANFKEVFKDKPVTAAIIRNGGAVFPHCAAKGH